MDGGVTQELFDRLRAEMRSGSATATGEAFWAWLTLHNVQSALPCSVERGNPPSYVFCRHANISFAMGGLCVPIWSS